MDSVDRLIEHQLVLRCQLGDRDAFQELVSRVDPHLRYFVRRLLRNEAETPDVVQEVWLTVFRRIGRLSHPEAFRAWLYHIAHSTTVNAFRRSAVRSRAEQTFAAAHPESVTMSTAAVDASELHAAIGELDDKHRAVMLLMLVGELTVQEIAEALSVPAGTVKSRAHHARQLLKQWLGGANV